MEAKTKQNDFKMFVAQLRECQIADSALTMLKSDGKPQCLEYVKSTLQIPANSHLIFG